DDAFRKRDHDEHQGDDGPPKGEKRSKTFASERQQQQQEWDAWVEDIYEDEVIPDDETPELIEEFQNVDKRVPIIFDDERMEATLRDMMRNQFKDAEEYAYHLEQSKNYMENQIVWESKQEDIRRSKPYAHVFYGPQRNPNEPPRYLYNKDLFFLKNGNSEERKKEFKTFNEEARLSIQHWKDSWHKRMHNINHIRVRDNPEEYFSDHRIVEVVRVTTEQQHGLDYMEQIIVMRENDKPDSFSEADFKYLNKNDIEDMSRIIWERVHDFQLGIESYQIKINLTALTLIFPSIKACDPYSIVDKPTTSLIYLNNKNEKRVMDLIDISKFCDATLERVLNEVKLKIFETEFLKKAPLLLDFDI
ncbi:hypothetical protein Tco_1566563, partial [Tanacetum coccineum]